MKIKRKKAKSILDEPGISVQEFVLSTPQGLPYEPRPGQIAFHQSKARYRWYCGGVRAGKTAAGCVEVLLTALRHPGARILVGRWSYKELRNTTWETLRAIIPPALIEDQHDGQNDLDIILKNGSKIVGWNLSNWRTIQGQELSAFYIDEVTEVPDPDCFRELTRRLSSNIGPCRGWVTGTPNGRDWAYKIWAESTSRDYELIRARTEENIHLRAGYVDELRRDLDPDQQARFLDAEFTETLGNVFWQFDPRKHVIDSFAIPAHWKKYRSIDPGDEDPASCIFLAIDEWGGHFVYDVYHQARTLISDQCVEILRMTGVDKVQWTCIDPFVEGHKSADTGKTLLQLYQEHGISPLYPGGGSKETGINVIQELLKPGPDGEPRLKIFAHCSSLIDEMKHWRRGRNGKPEDKDDHDIAALRYLLVMSPQAADSPFEPPEMSEIGKRFQEILASQELDPYVSEVGSQGIPWTG